MTKNDVSVFFKKIYFATEDEKSFLLHNFNNV